MKKSIVYILLIVLIMSVTTGCKKTEKKENEISKEENGVSSENTLMENNSQDVPQDNNDSSKDVRETKEKEDENSETENIEEESNESVEAETENAATKDKETENKGIENKETGNKVKENTDSKSKESDSKVTGNKETGSKGSGNKETANKETGNKGSGNKESGNKESGNKETANKETANKETGNKGTENSKDNDKQEAKDKDLLAIIKKIYEIKEPGLMLDNKSVDLSNEDSVKYYTGLSDSSKVKKIAASEAMILSHAYSLVLVQLNDASDAEKVAKEMLNGIDTRKWICVGADDLQVVSRDDVIMLFMVSSTLEENVTSQQIVDAFKEVSGGKLDIELKK
ncbi:hypothetical protein KQI61_12670 [Anaerocolumna aminovalerica]|uniref:hypothetical protein n=1 Tax=Anaerocolumna aminovalerica TaxID=1527 RepID=UPI001C0F109C|nr:hypothetical protein [Anaerocolumna aminovalerica]MBU5333051.1 hypothetical protein [Anaerocolumna aminovalerica]